MAIRDVAGNLRVGPFDKVELPDGRIAKPLGGTSKRVRYDVEGKEVESTSRYAPHAIQFDADYDDDELFGIPLTHPNRRRR